MNITHTSEWVSLGHPDKVADYISEYILDRYIEKDAETRYAVEVQIKDNFVSLAGEVTSKANFSNEDLAKFVEEAVNEIGYTKEYQKKFGKECTICGDDIHTLIHISQQSPDIAQGVNKDAWGDQGIFFGFYCGETHTGQGKDYQLAKDIGMALYQKAKNDEHLPLGLDIKTQATVSENEEGEFEIEELIVAIPTPYNTDKNKLRRIVRNTIYELYPESKIAKIIINGTGDYHIHGPIGDSGTTGRKLVVDFYGGRSRIGGGSPWTKDGTKADLGLNIVAHDIAKSFFKDVKKMVYECDYTTSDVSCCIGKKEILCVINAYNKDGIVIAQTKDKVKISPSFVKELYSLNKPIFAEMCRRGLFFKTMEEEIN